MKELTLQDINPNNAELVTLEILIATGQQLAVVIEQHSNDLTQFIAKPFELEL